MNLGFLFGAGALVLAGCGSNLVPLRMREANCEKPKAESQPLASLGQDRAPFDLSLPPSDGSSAKKLVYRLERETSGTAETIRAVVATRDTPPLAVGDRGTALVRDPHEGWQRESTGTEENLYALLPTPSSEKSMSADEARKRSQYVAVGSHGAAVIRGTDGVWRAERTETTADLYAVANGGHGILAVGAGGVIITRSGTGPWQKVPSHTNANLYGMGPCGNHLCVVGAGGTIVDCNTSHEVFACVPRKPVTDKDLRLITPSNVVLGDGIWLGLAPLPKDRDPWPPVDWVPWEHAPPGVANDSARAASENHWLHISQTLIVGRTGAAWLVDNPVVVKKPATRLSLPYGVDFHGVGYELVDGFLVGDQGTILHLGIHGFVPPTICLL